MSETRPAVTEHETTGTGSLRAIWVKRSHGGPMDPATEGALVAGQGLEGDACFGARRQVTLLDWERWQEAQDRLGAPVDPSARRANLLLTGVKLVETTGKVLRIGPVRLRIQGETRPCGILDEAHDGLKTELQREWGGGAYAEVLEGGAVRLGDGVSWE